jgi:hypothetical protein
MLKAYNFCPSAFRDGDIDDVGKWKRRTKEELHPGV